MFVKKEPDPTLDCFSIRTDISFRIKGNLFYKKKWCEAIYNFNDYITIDEIRKSKFATWNDSITFMRFNGIRIIP
jgi:hypothetical protein